MNKKLLLAFLCFSSLTFALPDYKSTSWGATDVVWIQDDVFPTFNITLYFADGGLGDDSSKAGTTQMMFDQLESGTNSKSQSKIADELDQLALSFSTQTGYESSTVSMSGLLREIKPSIDLFCHILNEASFPKQELNNAINRLKSQLQNLSASPGSVADRAAGIYNFAGTPFENPLTGRLSTISTLQSQDLINRWDFFKNSVKKRIYILGPKNILDYEKYFSSRCGFIGSGNLARIEKIPSTALQPTSGKVVFVKIPNSNQVQIRYAAPLSAQSFKDKFDLATLTSGVLGSGFTSLLMQEVRVKKGYTYGISASASPRYLNGQSIISTFTKNQTFLETVSTVEGTLTTAQNEFKDADHLESTKKFLVGKQLFQFDDSQKLMSTFINYDHLGREYSELTNFSKNIKNFTADDIKKTLTDLYPLSDKRFNWIFVGDESLVAKVKSKWKDNVIVLELKDIL